jgi:hypothetical protein
MAVVSSTVMPQRGSLVTEFDCFMVHFPFPVAVAPASQGLRAFALAGDMPVSLLVVASLCGIWQQSKSMHSECQPPLTRVRCFRRAATPPHGLSEIPQGKSCAFRDKAYMCDGPLGSPASFNNLARLRKCSATPFASTVAASPSCNVATSGGDRNGACQAVGRATPMSSGFSTNRSTR